MNHATKCFAAIGFSIVASVALGADAPASPAEARLIGAWQEGMTPSFATPEKRKMAQKAGLLGSIVVYTADHRFEIYPSCGPKQADLRKAGLKSIQGTWQLADSGDLTSTVNMRGMEMKTQSRLQWKDGQMISSDMGGTVMQKVGKYDGPLPPEC